MIRLSMTLGVIAALAMGACGGGDDDDNGNGADAAVGDPSDAGTNTDANTEPEFDAAPTLTPLEAFCAPQGPFANLIDTIGDCNGQIRSIDLAGNGLLSGASIEQVCLEQYGPMVAGGTVSVDESVLGDCLAFITSTSCEELNLDSIFESSSFAGTACEGIFVGSVELGGDCDVSEQCSGDAVCSPAKASCNVCSPRLANGENCGDASQCSEGTCNSQNECAAAVARGGSCQGNADCVGILICDEVSDTCESPLPSLGDACVSPIDCELTEGGVPFSLGMYCNRPGKGPGTCDAVPALGETCLPEEVLDVPVELDQGICNFHEYEWCELGTCAAPEIAALGEPCTLFAITGSGARRCDEGLLCTNIFSIDGSPIGRCVEPGYEGDSCDEGVDGEPPTAPCSPLYSCENGTCTNNSRYSGMCPAP